jgi:cytidine deaminase
VTTAIADCDPSELIARARACLDRAYAPYSRFFVAAAVLDDRGQLFTGVNVENASYGLTMCAERVAIFTAIASGSRKIVAIAVTSGKKSPVFPCGACRQVMAEFCAPEVPVYCDAESTRPVVYTVSALLPSAFVATHLGMRDRTP